MNSKYTLVLSFDYNQVTESLRYEFIQEDGQPYAQECFGRTAGTFNFNPGDTIYVKVVGGFQNSERPKQGFQFSVVDCSLVSIKAPQVVPLSLFDPNDAVAKLTDWGSMENYKWPDQPANCTAYSITSNDCLRVVAAKGQWKFSGYLSVNIDGITKLFFFDPESSAGGGAGLGTGGGGLP